LKLKPGMTANVKVEIAKRSNVLRVPAASLRFRPTVEMFSALNQTVPPEALATGGRGGRGGQGRGNRSDGADATTPAPSGPAGAAPSTAQGGRGSSTGAPPASGGRGPSTSSGQAGSAPDSGQAAGSGQAETTGRQPGEGRRGFDPARMMERFKGMSPDEQKQFIARMKDRGQDTSLFDKEIQPAAKAPAKGKGAAQGAQTIDALFAPLPSVESRGRVWLFIDHQLKPVSLRLGITDGANTEILSGELQQSQEVVIGITGLSPTRTTTGPGAGNPLMPAGRGGPPGGRGR
jgi:HlyD family secretion protein